MIRPNKKIVYDFGLFEYNRVNVKEKNSFKMHALTFVFFFRKFKVGGKKLG